MGLWDTYEERASVRGTTRREADLKREKIRLAKMAKESLSWQEDTVVDGVPMPLTIVNSDNLNEKKVITLPGESIKAGALIDWMDNHWLVTEKDANSTIYTVAKIVQCNHLLRWVSEDKVVHEQWCVVEDGTKYLTGEMEDRHFIITRGDTRVSMTITKNEHTCKFNRRTRFLIDDLDSEEKLAYTLSKPLRVGPVYNGEGVYKFVLQEVSSTPDDNYELGIADYYKYFPVNGNGDTNNTGEEPHTDNGKRVWL